LANYLATLAEVYVQDAFAMAHRSGGYMNVARLLPTYFGFDFIREYETMGAVIENPKKPMVVILGGAKIDKLDYLEDLQKIADCIILVGVLPKEVNLGILTPKVIVGSLTANGLDIDESTLNKISPILQTAETIIWAGSAGKWEEEENSMGTRALIQLVEQSGAQKIVAGGDTTAAIRRFGAMDKIDMICSGGGAMLEFLSKKALPAVEIATI
jgi:phosphoglycerate kinase